MVPSPHTVRYTRKTVEESHVPELPEVEHGRRVAESIVRGRRIRRVDVDDDRIVFDGIRPIEVKRALEGRRVEAVMRRGKQLWFRLDRSPHPLFHFGMTGAFRTRTADPLRLASSGSRDEEGAWPPRFSKIVLTLEDGGELAMVNKRRLGRIRLRDHPEEEPPISLLGFDPLLDPPGPAAFVEALGRRTGNLKGLLLDQSFAAGVGNWIADEVLYRARIDPRRTASSLSPAEARRLRTALLGVVERAVQADARSDHFPRTWLFHRRWGKVSGARTVRGEPIEFLTVAGRTTAWVPSRQR